MKSSNVSRSLLLAGLSVAASVAWSQSSLTPSTTSFFAETDTPYIYANLATAAGSGGVSLPVSASPAGILNLPGTLNIVPGATQNYFYYSANAVTTDTVVNLTIGALTVPITVKAVKPVSINPENNTIVGYSANPFLYVHLNAAGKNPNGYNVALSASNVFNMPSTLNIVPGSTNNYTYYSTNEVAVPTDVLVSATLNGNTITRTIRVNPLVTAPLNLSANPTVFGKGTVNPYAYMYTNAGPRATYPVTLTASPAGVLNLPSNFQITAGSTSNYFYFGTNEVVNDTVVTISAKGPFPQSPTVTGNITVLANRPTDITSSVTEIYGGAAAPFHYVRLRGAVGQNSNVVMSSSHPAIYNTPPTLTITAGNSENYFYANPNYVNSDTLVTFSATHSGNTLLRRFLIKANRPFFYNWQNQTIVGGQGNPYVYVGVPGALRESANISLTSSNPAAAQVPATMFMPAGSNGNYFYYNTSAVTVPTYVNFTANLGGCIGQGTTAILPNGQASVSGRIDFGSSFNPAARPTTITLERRNPTTGASAGSVTVPITADGVWYIINPGADYDYSVKYRSFLRRTLKNVGPTTTFRDFILKNGDIDGDNEVSILDYLALSANFEKDSSMSGWNTPGPDGIAPSQADLDADEIISILDYIILSENYDTAGDL